MKRTNNKANLKEKCTHLATCHKKTYLVRPRLFSKLKELFLNISSLNFLFIFIILPLFLLNCYFTNKEYKKNLITVVLILWTKNIKKKLRKCKE